MSKTPILLSLAEAAREARFSSCIVSVFGPVLSSPEFFAPKKRLTNHFPGGTSSPSPTLLIRQKNLAHLRQRLDAFLGKNHIHHDATQFEHAFGNRRKIFPKLPHCNARF